ncbi:CrcB-like protein-domain-containing protein [Xylaria palmicola]|nr:CrcB-like protein-domain-containing protein [Xylaria palmicola]
MVPSSRSTGSSGLSGTTARRDAASSQPQFVEEPARLASAQTRGRPGTELDGEVPAPYRNLPEVAAVPAVQEWNEPALDSEVPEPYRNLPEVEDVPAIQDRNELSRLDSRSIEELASRIRSQGVLQAGDSPPERQRQQHDAPILSGDAEASAAIPKWVIEFYTVSYLILFAIFGTLARLGLQALTFYPGTPISFSSVWPNFTGSLVIGFLTEDCMLFRHEREHLPTYSQRLARSAQKDEEAGSPDPGRMAQDMAAAKTAHLAMKKTLPLYIGLATGFCGSFTSFSSFIRDIFLALSNDLPTPDGDTTPRNGGYSFLALLAVTLGTISLSFTGFHLGTHLAQALEFGTPSLRYPSWRRVIDPLAAALGWGSWLGAVVLSVAPPDRHSSPGASEAWRGRATLALVFAPLGCLARFYASARLNGRFAAFPLGTFAVNVAGTAVLGLAWDLAHAPAGGAVGCQVLQGVGDGFCGCLTTVSTWVLELSALARRRAYVYGCASVVSALVLLIAIMGGLRWSQGFSDLLCVH